MWCKIRKPARTYVLKRNRQLLRGLNAKTRKRYGHKAGREGKMRKLRQNHGKNNKRNKTASVIATALALPPLSSTKTNKNYHHWQGSGLQQHTFHFPKSIADTIRSLRIEFGIVQGTSRIQIRFKKAFKKKVRKCFPACYISLPKGPSKGLKVGQRRLVEIQEAHRRFQQRQYQALA